MTLSGTANMSGAWRPVRASRAQYRCSVVRVKRMLSNRTLRPVFVDRLGRRALRLTRDDGQPHS
jgi:hypothetical protein